ncbi:MAG: substrate-binding domain-containing protein, partial [Brevundimonas sp.]|nr:substrate-binding domain-containing protein [Brevundimonas sp.]
LHDRVELASIADIAGGTGLGSSSCFLVGFLHALHALKGERPTPAQLAVCGFDDTPSALLSTPPLTTIRQPVAEMAAAATRLLLPSSAGKPGHAERVDFVLVDRASTRPLD